MQGISMQVISRILFCIAKVEECHCFCCWCKNQSLAPRHLRDVCSECSSL